MNSKERVLTALRREVPDRVPVWVTVVGDLADRLAQTVGIPADPLDAYLTNRISNAALLTTLGNDVVGIGSTAPHGQPTTTRSDGFLQDEWGFVYRRVPHGFGSYLEIVGRPLAGIRTTKQLAGHSGFGQFRLPDPEKPGRFDIARDRAQAYGRTHALLGIVECTVFEMAWNLVGLEQFLTDMALKREYVGPLLDMVADYSIAVGLRLIQLGADAILTGDDLGMEVGPMMSLAMWRRWLKPRLHRVLEAYRLANPGIVIAYHTCGSVLPFIDELADMGVQVLNPIQVTAHGMDAAWLKRAYGDRLAFCGGVDQRQVLPHGSPGDVEREVQRRIAELGPGGGYLLAPTHDIQADTPVDNVLAVFEAVKRWGCYPL